MTEPANETSMGLVLAPGTEESATSPVQPLSPPNAPPDETSHSMRGPGGVSGEPTDIDGNIGHKGSNDVERTKP